MSQIAIWVILGHWEILKSSKARVHFQKCYRRRIRDPMRQQNLKTVNVCLAAPDFVVQGPRVHLCILHPAERSFCWRTWRMAVTSEASSARRHHCTRWMLLVWRCVSITGAPVSSSSSTTPYAHTSDFSFSRPANRNMHMLQMRITSRGP